jgi:CMP/dCMP kinase
VHAIEASIRERDFKDSSRSDGPLAESNDSVTVDTSDSSIDDVVSRIMALLVDREAARGIRSDAQHRESDE